MGADIRPVRGAVAAASAAGGAGGPQARPDPTAPSTPGLVGGPPPSERGGFADVADALAGMAGLLFGWTPDIFWAATPAELATLVRATGADAPAAPVDLATLMERFPDE